MIEKLNELAEALESALTYKAPYILLVDNEKMNVSCEEFLKFHLDWAIEQIYSMLPDEKETFEIEWLPDGGCIVNHDGEISQHTKKEVDEMKRDHLIALQQIMMGEVGAQCNS